MNELAAFVAVAIVVIVTPGPDTALLIRNALLGGRRAGVLTALGVSTGQATWALATSVGLAALLAASEPAFRALRLAGAAYLVYLGVEALRAAWRGERPETRKGSSRPAPFRQGVLSNLSNPKMAVFFTSLLPQFGGTSFVALLALGLVFSLMTFVWLAAYGAAVAKAGDFLRRTGIRRLLDAVTGAVLVALGLRVATERR
jgi:threonine/homoserine/homoserine lactone efflux protein